jgi:hypothetical protein
VVNINIQLVLLKIVTTRTLHMWKFLLSIFVLQLTENGGYVETAQLSTIHQVTEEGDGFINQIVILEPDNTSQIEWNKLIEIIGKVSLHSKPSLFIPTSAHMK